MLADRQDHRDIAAAEADDCGQVRIGKLGRRLDPADASESLALGQPSDDSFQAAGADQGPADTILSWPLMEEMSTLECGPDAVFRRGQLARRVR
jgi:hypothetical protein